MREEKIFGPVVVPETPLFEGSDLLEAESIQGVL